MHRGSGVEADRSDVAREPSRVVRPPEDDGQASRWARWRRAWALGGTIASGLLALLWLLLRSGTKPSRFTYPCQQAAFGTAAAAFGVPLVAAVIAARRQLIAWVRKPAGVALGATGLLAAAGLWGYASRAGDYRAPMLDPRPDYRAEVYHVTDCPQVSVDDRFIGLDNLITLMGREGLKLYQSSAESLLAGPDGIIAVDDVVVIKINYQWSERGGTNVDLLRGLIHRIVNHPDTFTGEVVVCENAQFVSTNGFDRDENNAQNILLSPHDVVAGFQTAGHTVSHYDWTLVRETWVGEYSDGDLNDGYVVYAYDGAFQGRVSYPKFQTENGTYISLRDGIWDDASGTYDRAHLKFINVPVLKSHSAEYGATACVKNYMGVVTTELSTNSHYACRGGVLGALLAEIQPADLNILDCIWINADPNDGPWTTYQVATRRDELIASVDPIAADIWAVTNVLIPAFIANGFWEPWPQPSADPGDANSEFREYLDNSMGYILAAGYDATNDIDQIDAFTWNGAGDFDGDSDVDFGDIADFQACFTGLDGDPEAGCEPADFDEDGDVDLDDWAELMNVNTIPLDGGES
jgi:hypothetical protein